MANKIRKKELKSDRARFAAKTNRGTTKIGQILGERPAMVRQVSTFSLEATRANPNVHPGVKMGINAELTARSAAEGGYEKPRAPKKKKGGFR